MANYYAMTRQELEEEYQKEYAHFNACKEQNLNLNMARGKPSNDQLDLVINMLRTLNDAQACVSDDIDVRNYGELEGMPCA